MYQKENHLLMNFIKLNFLNKKHLFKAQDQEIPLEFY